MVCLGLQDEKGAALKMSGGKNTVSDFSSKLCSPVFLSSDLISINALRQMWRRFSFIHYLKYFHASLEVLSAIPIHAVCFPFFGAGLVIDDG